MLDVVFIKSVDFVGLCNHSFCVAGRQESKRNGVVSNRVRDFLVRLSAGLPNKFLRFRYLPGLRRERAVQCHQRAGPGRVWYRLVGSLETLENFQKLAWGF